MSGTTSLLLRAVADGAGRVVVREPVVARAPAVSFRSDRAAELSTVGEVLGAGAAGVAGFT
jgi:hypothetical protein